MPRHSAGVLPYRSTDAGLLVFLAHPGGPFWARKDDGVWSVVKGEYDPDTEEPAAAAAREFTEEIGAPPPPPPWVDLGQVRQSSGKVVTAFAARADDTLTYVASNTIEIEWPRGSGRTLTIPEVDRAEWMPISTARRRLIPAQREFLTRLETHLGAGDPPGSPVEPGA